MSKKIYLGVMILIIFLALGLVMTFKQEAKEIYMENDNILNDGAVAVYVEQNNGAFVNASSIPAKTDGYVIDDTQTACNGNAQITWDNDNWEAHVSSISSNNVSCYLFFRKKTLSEQTLSKLELKSKGTIGPITGPACDSDENCGDETVKRMDQNGVYYAGEDNDGGSYIFRGTVDNNWVKFGQTSDNQDIWWRIIRINGNGSIRLIYSGKGAQPPTNNGENMMENQRYNTDMNDNTYVGYYYGSPNQTTYEAAHTNEHPSNLAIQTEDWFTSSTNLDDQAQLNHIDENVGFCNDRKLSNYNHGFNDYLNKGYGTEPTWYAIIDRTQEPNSNEALISLVPTLKCGETDSNDYDRDYFTWKEKATRGNRKLNQPVGHITADEVIYAGAFSGEENNSLWLKLDTTGYLTMTPEYFHNSGLSYVVRVDETGRFGAIGKSIGIRPVINLKADTSFEPSNESAEWGTKENPYVVSN